MLRGDYVICEIRGNMQRKNLIVLLLIVMAGTGLWKYQKMKDSPVSNIGIHQEDASSDSEAPIITDDGVMLPDSLKESVVSNITDQGLGNMEDENAGENKIPEQYINASFVEYVRVTGPNTLPKAECLEKYKNSAEEIALYASGSDNAKVRSMTKDFGVCHAAKDGVSYCSYADKTCEVIIPQAKYYYNVLAGKPYTTEDCVSIFQREKIPGINIQQMCQAMPDIIKGKQELPPQVPDIGRESLAFLSGKTSSCASVRLSLRYDCRLLADMVMGIRTGSNKFFLYDAFARQDCSKVDQDLVEKYCSGKIK